MADLPDFYMWTETTMPVITTFDRGVDANKSAIPVAGQAYLTIDTKILYVCFIDGTWTNVSALYLLLAGGTMSGNIAMGNNIVSGMKAPTADGEAARKKYVDDAIDTDIATHADIAAAHHAKTVNASELTAGELPIARLPTRIKTLTITFIIDGGGSAITTGQKGHLRIPFACTISRVTMLADQSGSIVVDIWKDTYNNFPPTDADSIAASAVPTITTAQKSEDSTLTGWTTALSADDILAFNVDSCTTITRVIISLKVVKT